MRYKWFFGLTIELLLINHFLGVHYGVIWFNELAELGDAIFGGKSVYAKIHISGDKYLLNN